MEATDIPAGDAICHIAGNFDGTTWSNGFALHLEHIDDPTPADLGDLAALMLSAYGTFIVPSLSDQFTAETAQVVYNVGLGLIVEGNDENIFTGDDTGNPLPANTAYVISWKDGSYYRGGKPRSFIGGMTESHVEDAGLITAEGAAGFADNANTFLAAVNALSTDNFTSVTLGCFHNPGLDPVFFAPYIEGAATVRRKWASQRRRLNS